MAQFNSLGDYFLEETKTRRVLFFCMIKADSDSNLNLRGEVFEK